MLYTTCYVFWDRFCQLLKETVLKVAPYVMEVLRHSQDVPPPEEPFHEPPDVLDGVKTWRIPRPVFDIVRTNSLKPVLYQF